MKKKILEGLAIICMFCGCAVTKPTIATSDSVRIEYRERIVRDTVEYELPVIIEKHITDDTLSVIENKYAKTTAVVRNGRLSHDLQTKPAKIQVPVAVEVHDTTYVEKSAETSTEIVEVERELTAFQKYFIWSGKVFTLLMFLAAMYLTIRLVYKSRIVH